VSLADVAQQSKIIITCGPGGVGKTTCAAALGLAVARSSNRKVLVMTVDPARRLADALGLSGIGNDATRVELDGPGQLFVAMLDTKASWDALIRRHAPDQATTQRILENTLYQNITGRFIQSHDYIAMERLHELVDTGLYDLIVVDTPPTRNALDFLDAPSRMADFFSSRLLRWLIAPAKGGVMGLAAKPFNSIADRILGGPFVSDITEFFLLLNTMYAGFVKRARMVERLIGEASTSFVVVSTVEAVPVSEASFFVEELERRKLHVRGWILNRVLPASISSDELAPAISSVHSADLAGLATQLGIDEESLRRVRDALVDNVNAWSSVARQEVSQTTRLAHGNVALFPIPTLDGEISELTGLSNLGDLLLHVPAVLRSSAWSTSD
jgi:anion-transporting  ArsA/GET3 family ATPase